MSTLSRPHIISGEQPPHFEEITLRVKYRCISILVIPNYRSIAKSLNVIIASLHVHVH